ncbi:hypothetical protein E4U13_003050 [Claviceps humidiphila]|uniref:Uncharacterized protein n=1 Tax=Claviceps humidiphila TaxID=1294629 RepID=A0A9P7Q1G3_9HYPO|nr:hypothetical protein E4U13_003050 [Claviceps humidiphila]
MAPLTRVSAKAPEAPGPQGPPQLDALPQQGVLEARHLGLVRERLQRGCTRCRLALVRDSLLRQGVKLGRASGAFAETLVKGAIMMDIKMEGMESV